LGPSTLDKAVEIGFFKAAQQFLKIIKKVSSQKVGESEFIFAGVARKNELTPHFIEKILKKTE
jgi:hypothetical protein